MTNQRVLEYPTTTENIMQLIERAVFDGRDNLYLCKDDETSLLGEVFFTKVTGDGRFILRLLDEEEEKEYIFQCGHYSFGVRVNDNNEVVATTFRNKDEYYYLSAH